MPKYQLGDKQKHRIDFSRFNTLLEKVDQVNNYGYSGLFVRSLLALFFWLGIRKTEAIGSRSHKYILKPCARRQTEIVKWTRVMPGIHGKDIKVEGDWLTIKCPARKHGSRDEDMPLRIPLEFPYADLIVQQWKVTEPGQRVWPIPEVTAWRIMKQLDKERVIHSFRHNRVTELCNNPTVSLAEICSWTGLTPQTINDYLEKSERFIRTAAEKMRVQYHETAHLEG